MISGVRTTCVLLVMACSLECLPVIAQTSAASQTAAIPTFDLSASQEGYLIGPGDRVTIKVFGAEEFSGNQVVLPDGTVTLNYIGTVQASNRTVPDLASAIESRLATYMKRPRVSVRMESLRPMRVAVAGEVLQPGPRQIQSTLTANITLSQPTTVLPTVTAALSAAGGVTNQADVSEIKLSRRESNGRIVEKRVDLWRTISEGRTEEDILLKDGDTIWVPRRTAGSPVDSRLLARTTLAPGKIQVRVFGEVNKGGTQELTARSTVVDAIASAGGLTNLAAPDNVEIATLETDGRVTNRVIDVNAAIRGDASQNVQLQDQDAVIVRRSFGGDMLNALSVFASPASTVANLFFIFRNFNNR